MNLISLMCLCSLSSESLLLFNGVLQSYLIQPPRARLPACCQCRLPVNAPYSATCGKKKKKKTARCVSVICVIGERINLDRNTVGTFITVFPTLNSAHDCLSASALILFYSLFTVSASVLSVLPPPRLSHVPHQRG